MSILVFDISFNWQNTPAFYIVPIAFLQILFLGGPLNEELGWRGFALPALQAKTNAGIASLIIGVIWGIWHLPLFIANIPGYTTMPIAAYLINTCALSIIFTHIYNSGNGQLWLSILLHAVFNTVNWLLLPIVPNEHAILVSICYVSFTGLISLYLIYRYGFKQLASSYQK